MPAKGHVSVESVDGIAVLRLSNPPVNALSHGLREELMAALEHARRSPEVRAVVLAGTGNTFVGGADIREFGKPYLAPTLWQIDDALLAMGKPTVAAIDGYALGGGLELAFHCHWRVAQERARMGLPEVKLGLMPGAGGTQYWTRLAGPRSALKYLTSGDLVGAAQAAEMALVDRVADGEVVDAALAFASLKLAEGGPLPDYNERTERLAEGTPDLFDSFVADQGKTWAGLMSPAKIVDCIRGACTRPLSEMLEAERKAFAACEASPQAAALMHLFFAERDAGKLLGDATRPPVRTVGVIGAGTMGGGIAMAFANAGYTVTLVDATVEALERGVAQIQSNYDGSVARGRTPAAKAEAAFARIMPTLTFGDVAECDLVVEAVFEDMSIKHDVIGRLDQLVAPDAIIATNTSTLDIDVLAEAASRPERVVGMHFFSPANVMKLLEVVRSGKTDAGVLQAVVALGRKLGKIPVIAGNGEGFIGNYILDAYGREMDLLVEDGASPWQVDAVMRSFGFAMGLFAMRDMAGLDVIRRIREHRREWERPGRYPLVADRLWEMGRYGQKTGAGYYVYDGRKAMPDPVMDQIVEDVARERGIVRRPISDDEIREKLLAAMVSAGQRLLDSGVAQSAADIDLVMVHGYGFPRFLGGPMHWAEQQGWGTSSKQA